MNTPRDLSLITLLARDDPAFSSDPRSHPHFALLNARSYKALPPKPQRVPLPAPSPPKPCSSITTSVLKPVPTNIPRKARMKAFVRRLTTRHSLDRIDELDETDPFGGSYHHDGPYEAIGSNFPQPSLPHNHHQRRESDPHLVRPNRYQSARGETGLSLHLEPGQILQQNTIYTSHLSSMAALPRPFPPQSDTVSNPTPSRPQSLPNPRTHHHQDTSPLALRDGFQTRRSSLHAPRERCPRDATPDIPNNTPFHHEHSATSYVLHQTENTVFPPPRYESRLHSLSPPRSSHRTPTPSHLTIDNAFAHSSSIQDRPLDPLRIRHLPKRLVMPAPLQPRPPQSQYNSTSAEPPAWRDAYSDNYALEGTCFEENPAMYSQEPRLLRKRSSALAAKAPIPDHVVISQDDAASRTANSRAKTANDAGGIKERPRRRKLSKRKSDI